MVAARVLILGGHGRVSLLLTRLLLQEEGWHFSSVVCSPDQTDKILQLRKRQKGRAGVLKSLEDVRSSEQAKQVTNKVDPNYVTLSAGKVLRGWKIRPSQTYAIDRDAAKHFIEAAPDPQRQQVSDGFVYSQTKESNALVEQEDWKAAQHADKEVLPEYHKAKVEADECLTTLEKQRNEKNPDFQAFNLRPGTPSVSTLESDASIVENRVGCIEGEDLGRIYAQAVRAQLVAQLLKGFCRRLNQEKPYILANGKRVKLLGQ